MNSNIFWNMEPNIRKIQCWLIIQWTRRNKFQWNLKRNSNILIQENMPENVVCEISANL